MVYLLKEKFNDNDRYVVNTDMDCETFSKFVSLVLDRNFTNEYRKCNKECSPLDCFAETFDNCRGNGYVFHDGVMYSMSVHEPTLVEIM